MSAYLLDIAPDATLTADTATDWNGFPAPIVTTAAATKWAERAGFTATSTADEFTLDMSTDDFEDDPITWPICDGTVTLDGLMWDRA